MFVADHDQIGVDLPCTGRNLLHRFADVSERREVNAGVDAFFQKQLVDQRVQAGQRRRQLPTQISALRKLVVDRLDREQKLGLLSEAEVLAREREPVPGTGRDAGLGVGRARRRVRLGESPAERDVPARVAQPVIKRRLRDRREQRSHSRCEQGGQSHTAHGRANDDEVPALSVARTRRAGASLRVQERLACDCRYIRELPQRIGRAERHRIVGRVTIPVWLYRADSRVSTLSVTPMKIVIVPMIPRNTTMNVYPTASWCGEVE